MRIALLNLLIGSIFGILIKYYSNISIVLISIGVFLILLFKTKKKVLFYILGISIFILISSYIILGVDENFNGECLIIEKHDSYYILKSNNIKYLFYSDEDYNLYSKLNIIGTVNKLETKTSLNISSFNDYLYKQGVYYRLKASDISIRTNGDVFRPKLINLLTNNLSEYSKNITSLLILGDKSVDKDFYNSLSNIGIVHLFVISGFHLNILYGIFKRVFKKMDDIYLVLLLTPYVYLLNFSLPILRAYLYILFKSIADKLKKEFDPFSALFLIGFILLIINYHNLFSLSFQFTMITNLVILVINNINKASSFIYKLFFRGLLIQLSILPLLLLINYEYSLLAPLFTTLVSIPVSFMYVFGLINCLIKFSDVIYNPLCKIFISIIEKLNSININVIFGKPKLIVIVIFYIFYGLLLYFLITRNKKKTLLYSFLLFSTLSFQYYYPYLLGKDETIFIDVGQGDSTLILGKHNKYSVLIDTGGSQYVETSKQYIIPLLKSKGIKRLDAVIITHDDFDHNGSLDYLRTNYDCLKVYEGWKEDTIDVNNFKLTNLNKYYSKNDEDNAKSAVFYFENGNKRYLVMGDAPKEIEYKIIKYNPNLYCDILRIGHHGSKTSTSEELIEQLNPKIAIISVGYNTYGHPTSEVLEILEKYGLEIYRTDISNNISITSKNIIENY